MCTCPRGVLWGYGLMCSRVQTNVCNIEGNLTDPEYGITWMIFYANIFSFPLYSFWGWSERFCHKPKKFFYFSTWNLLGLSDQVLLWWLWNFVHVHESTQYTQTGTRWQMSNIFLFFLNLPFSELYNSVLFKLFICSFSIWKLTLLRI